MISEGQVPHKCLNPHAEKPEETFSSFKSFKPTSGLLTFRGCNPFYLNQSMESPEQKAWLGTLFSSSRGAG